MDYFERKLDQKNRLTIPKEIRNELGNDVIVTQGFKKYLHLYSKKVWEKDMETALTGDILDERIADLNINFRTGKVNSRLDGKQGRVILEPHHLAYANIKKDVAIIRAGKYWRIVAR